VLATACGGTGPITTTDTGYEGTWGRGNDRVSTRISIAKVDGEYKYRVGLISDDGKRVIRCDWDGKCNEFIDGEKTSEYQHTTSFDDATQHLVVECVGKVHYPTAASIHDIDELVVKGKGLKLRRKALRRGDKTYKQGDYPRPYINYTKISDQIVDPPAGWSQPSG